MITRLSMMLAVLAVAVFAVIAVPENVLANGGPHGDYRNASTLTDACAGCHRLHQGLSTGKLLKAESQYALCLTCHNGAGSVLNVLDGVRLAGVGYDPATSLLTLDSGAIPRDNSATNMYLSLAPYGEMSAAPGKDGYITLRIRNKTGSAITPVLAASDVLLGTTIGSDFNASDFVDVTVGTSGNTSDAENPGNPITSTVVTTVTVPANDTAYVRLRVKPSSTATAGDGILTTVTATFAGQTGTVKAQTRAGDTSLPVLNGGGFNYVGAKVTTSRHNANPADNARNPWGFGGMSTPNYAAGGTGLAVNTGENPNALSEALQCTSCHNPHGTTNYRLLKLNNNGVAVDVKAFYSGALSTDEGARGLESGAPADKYTKEYYGSSASNSAGFASFCGSCHTAYPSDGASLGLSSTSAFGSALHYRHRTEMPYTNWTNPNTGANPQNPELTPIAGTGGTGDFPTLRLASNTTTADSIVTCLTCHRVHGTGADMTGYALKKMFGGKGDDDITPSQVNESRTTLLYTDNRGMCQACHQW